MNMATKKILRKGWLGLLLVFFIGIAFTPMAQPEQAEKQILRMATKYSDAKTLDPHRATGGQDRVVVGHIFNGLVRYKPGNLSADSIEPDLASSWTVSSDGREWTFYLNKNITFHAYNGKQGYELTSDDIIYSLKRAADPKRSAFAADYSNMTFEATDRYTVKITLKEAVSPYLFLPKFADRAGGLIVCKKAIEDKGEDWFKTHPVGTGAFMFKQYTPMEKVILVRNLNYFRGEPKLDEIDIFYMPNLSSRELAIQKGEIDVIEGIRDPSWLKKAKKIPGLIVDAIGTGETMEAHLNMSVEPLNLLKVRQAIAYALNRNEYMAVFGDEITDPIYSAVPVGDMIGGLSREECTQEGLLYEFDIGKARQLLSEAGYPNGFSLKVLTSESDAYRTAYTLLQAQLRRVGINIDLSIVDHASFHAKIRENLNPIVIYLCRRPNPDIILTQFYFSESIVVKGKKPVTNFSHIGALDADGDGKIESIDDLILAARKEKDPQKQIEFWKEAQKNILRYMVSYPLISSGFLFARKPYVDWGYELVTIADGPKATEITRILKKGS